MHLYSNPERPEHAGKNARFLKIVNSYSHLSFFQPQPEKAPWHWQCMIDLGGDVQLLNFWPHLLKGQRDGFKAVEGEHALRGIIEQALVDAGTKTFEPFED